MVDGKVGAHIVSGIGLGGSWYRSFSAAARITAVAVLTAFVCLLVRNNPFSAGSDLVRPIDIFWKLVVPLVPAMLLVAPALWRNVCPLAYFNLLGHRARKALVKGEGGSSRQGLWHDGHVWFSKNGLYLGMVLLFVIVPLRLNVLNYAGDLLAVVLTVLVFVTFVAGIIFPFKSGWCSSICPVYPVEKFYAMSPLVYGENTLCQDDSGGLRCIGCSRACLDVEIGSEKANALAGEQAQSEIFPGMFPGFVLAYLILSANGGWRMLPWDKECLVLYSVFAVLILVSLIVYRLCSRGIVYAGFSEAGSRRFRLVWVALTFNLYYLIAAPAAISTLAALFGLQPVAAAMTTSLECAIGSLSVLWLWCNWS